MKIAASEIIAATVDQVAVVFDDSVTAVKLTRTGASSLNLDDEDAGVPVR